MTTADPFAGLPDDEVLKQAAAHLRKAAMFPAASLTAAAERLRFQTAMAEFDRRELIRVMHRLAFADRLRAAWADL